MSDKILLGQVTGFYPDEDTTVYSHKDGVSLTGNAGQQMRFNRSQTQELSEILNNYLGPDSWALNEIRILGEQLVNCTITVEEFALKVLVMAETGIIEIEE